MYLVINFRNVLTQKFTKHERMFLYQFLQKLNIVQFLDAVDQASSQYDFIVLLLICIF